MQYVQKIQAIILFCGLFMGVVGCSEKAAEGYEKVPYRNLAPGVEYVGMNTCKLCHADVHDTFIHTGMGQSFANAHQRNSDAVFDEKALVYEPNSNFYYWPYVEDSLMYVLEFRLDDKGDTIHQRREQISYIVGSGQHTNSHIVNFNGYIYQAPITYYTQDGKWDMAPSFREEGNARFSRLLNAECITCHNNLPEMAPGSENKVIRMPTGIECERCHGPGGVHVAEKKAGIMVDIREGIDSSIVNPAKLPRALQLDLCKRCHLQGTAVLEPGKTFFDFKPGMRLNEVVNVFLPRFSDSDKQFIMASQADRLQQSKCYKNTDLTCLTCHDPHISVREVEAGHFVKACLQCHQAGMGTECSASIQSREAVENKCYTCHMPKSKSLDIAHVRITDHKIQRKPANTEAQGQQFYGLQILTREDPTPLDMARGYLALYDKFAAKASILDSIYYYLARIEQGAPGLFDTKIHYLFNKTDYAAMAEMAANRDITTIDDAWTAYRIGEALHKVGKTSGAADYLQKATELMPLNLDFLEKEALVLMDLKRYKEARKKLDFVLKENRKRPIALCNRGLLFVVQGNLPTGEQYYDEAIRLNPDYEQALLNKAAVRNMKGDKDRALELVQRVLRINPGNEEAERALEYISN